MWERTRKQHPVLPKSTQAVQPVHFSGHAIVSGFQQGGGGESKLVLDGRLAPLLWGAVQY